MYVLQAHEAVVVLVEEGEGSPAVAVDQRLVGGAQQRGARHQVHRELVHAAHQVPPIIIITITIITIMIMIITIMIIILHPPCLQVRDIVRVTDGLDLAGGGACTR